MRGDKGKAVAQPRRQVAAMTATKRIASMPVPRRDTVSPPSSPPATRSRARGQRIMPSKMPSRSPPPHPRSRRGPRERTQAQETRLTQEGYAACLPGDSCTLCIAHDASCWRKPGGRSCSNCMEKKIGPCKRLPPEYRYVGDNHNSLATSMAFNSLSAANDVDIRLRASMETMCELLQKSAEASQALLQVVRATHPSPLPHVQHSMHAVDNITQQIVTYTTGGSPAPRPWRAMARGLPFRDASLRADYRSFVGPGDDSAETDGSSNGSSDESGMGAESDGPESEEDEDKKGKPKAGPSRTK